MSTNASLVEPSLHIAGDWPSVQVRRHELVAAVHGGLRRWCRVPRGAKVVIGCSGGADSLSLLLAGAVLHRRRPALIEPVVVHVHHHLRDTADDDQRFVEAVCRATGIRCVIKDVDPRSRPGNGAAAARELRYRALAEVAAEVGAAHVAVAHHAEDQLETMVMGLARGGGLSSVSGMSWRRRLTDTISLVRPMLTVRRHQCEEFCRVASVIWCEDPTNDDLTYARAAVRHQVIPVLEALWPDAAARATSTAELIRATAACLDPLLCRWFGPSEQRRWDRDALCELEPALIAAGLLRAARSATSRVDDRLGQRQLGQAATIILDRQAHHRQLHWPGGLTLVVTPRTCSLET